MAKLTRRNYILADPQIKSDLVLLFKPEERIVIFDIGACEGEDSIRYSRLYPNAKIHLFEPRPDNLQIIDKNLREFECTSVVVSSLALSNAAGEATFYLSSGQPENPIENEDWDFGNKSSSLLPPGSEMKVHDWLEFKDQITVQTERLDTYCQQQGISRIDFIHMDVQGAELMVLEGAGSMLKNIGAIWLEVEAVELYKDQPLRHDVEQFMNSHGFVCVKSTVGSISGDQLYLNPSLISPEKIAAVRTKNTRPAPTGKWKGRLIRLRNLLLGKR